MFPSLPNGPDRRAKASAINIAPHRARDAADYFEALHGSTPLLPLEKITRNGVDITVWGKFENVQSVYTFKARGAEWFIHHIADHFHSQTGMFRGKDSSEVVLVTASAGNHGQGVAWSAKRHNFTSRIFVPASAPSVKLQRMEELGAELIKIEGNFDACKQACLDYKAQTVSGEKRIFVPPYESPEIMAGQGSCAVEILRTACGGHNNYMHFIQGFSWATEEFFTIPDVIICPVGGGGLISGVGAVVKEFNKVSGLNIKVIGVQSQAADSMYLSLKTGKLEESSNPAATTIADGINVKQASERMFATVSAYADQIVLVEEHKIFQGISSIATHPALVHRRWPTRELSGMPHRELPGGQSAYSKYRRINKIEGAAAAGYAAVMFGDYHDEIDWSRIAGQKKKINVVCLLTGANIQKDKWDLAQSAYPRAEECQINGNILPAHADLKTAFFRREKQAD